MQILRDSIPLLMVLPKNHGVGGSSQVSFRPHLENELLDMPVEQFLASSRFEQREYLDQIGVYISSIE